MTETAHDPSAPIVAPGPSPALENLTGLENTRNFIAGVAQGMLIGAQSRARMVLGCGVRYVPGSICQRCPGSVPQRHPHPPPM